MRPLRFLPAAVVVAVWVIGADAQVPVVDGGKFAGLKWTFVRIKYGTYDNEGSSRLAYWDEPWAIDAPAAEQNLSRRLKAVTAIDVGDPMVLIESPISATLLAIALIALVAPFVMRGLGKFKASED